MFNPIKKKREREREGGEEKRERGREGGEEKRKGRDFNEILNMNNIIYIHLRKKSR